MSELRSEQDDDVFHLTVEVLPLEFDTFTLPPYEAPALEDVDQVDPWDALAAEQMALLLADAGTLWTEEALMADPGMIEFYAQRDALEAYLAAPTIEEKLAVVAPYQQDEFAVV